MVEMISINILLYNRIQSYSTTTSYVNLERLMILLLLCFIAR